jgi:glycosyltransferase involved in cell wall biosynthesis
MSTLSAIMIVKNEESNLPRCLESLRGVCDEIVVVDTGSTDRTVEIARQSGAHVEFFAWTGNESDARNYSVAQARGDWLFQVDADEELSLELRQELPAELSRLDREPHIRSCSVLWENHYLGGETSSTRILRLNRRESFAYTGGIHPIATYQPQTYALRGALHHYGYQWTAERRQRKAQHILDHLRPYLAESHPSFDRWCQYLSALNLIGDKALFVQAWEKVSLYSPQERIASAATPAWLENSANFFRYFSCCDDFENAAFYADEILQVHPRHIASRFYRLQRRVKQRAWNDALRDAREILDELEHDPGPNNPVWPVMQRPAARAWHWLAETHLSSTFPTAAPSDELPVWLLEPLTLPAYLFHNCAPNLDGAPDGEGTELLRLLIDAETFDRCRRNADALRLLIRCLQRWSGFNWLRIGLDRLQRGEPFRLETLAERTVHLT